MTHTADFCPNPAFVQQPEWFFAALGSMSQRTLVANATTPSLFPPSAAQRKTRKKKRLLGTGNFTDQGQYFLVRPCDVDGDLSEMLVNRRAAGVCLYAAVTQKINTNGKLRFTTI